MDTSLITRLGEVVAKAANRAIRNGDRAGGDQNRGQFVAMVTGVLGDVPPALRGDEASAFLEQYREGAYGPSATGQ